MEPFLLMTLHFSQIGFTDALTFILNLHFYRPPHPRNPARILIRSPFRSVLTDLLPKRPLPIVAWKFNTCNHFEAKKHQFFRVFLPFFYKKVPACDGSRKRQNPFHRLCILAGRFLSYKNKVSYMIKKNVPWHILAPRRGCLGNRLPLRRVRILAEHFYRMETKFPIR